MSGEAGSGLIVAEPRGRYSARPPLVVDCSVLAAVLFDEPERERAALVLAGKELFAPNLLDHELASVALKKSGHAPEELIVQGLTDFAQLQLTRCSVDILTQWHMALRFGLSAYDAAYLSIAVELEAPLATFDQRLGEAARIALA